VDDLAEGSYKVVLKKSGYSDWGKIVKVTEGDTTTVDADLDALTAAPTAAPTTAPTTVKTVAKSTLKVRLVAKCHGTVHDGIAAGSCGNRWYYLPCVHCFPEVLIRYPGSSLFSVLEITSFFCIKPPLLRHQSPVNGQGALGFKDPDLLEIE